MNPLLLVDSYKIHHQRMYPEGMTKLYSNLTPRKSRLKNVNSVVFFGLQAFIIKYLQKAFKEEFFDRPWKAVEAEYQRHCPVDIEHIKKLWQLGYLPLEIKALREGTRCPIGVPMLTITNTHIDFGWLVNYLETLLSCCLWQPITSATIAHEYKKLLVKYAKATGGAVEFVDWQGHDFSLRGMSSPESGILSGMGHLLSFTGTDTIPAIYACEEYYFADGLVGASVPATEHSVMCMGQKEEEIVTFRRLLNLYPTGILSVVSDTWDLWKVLTTYLPELKEEILARDGKLVIRPDSGDPVDIICGTSTNGIIHHVLSVPPQKGVIELLWDVFGGTIVKGEDGHEYKQLDSHIGAIYGDSITLDRAEQICERLKAKGFSSTNIVLGIGSYTYQYNTRDTFGMAMKATYGEITRSHCTKETGCMETNSLVGTEHEGVDMCEDGCVWEGVEKREIYKDPITDDGTKKSKKGLLTVDYAKMGEDGKKVIAVYDGRTWGEEKQGLLRTVFINGTLVRRQTLQDVKDTLNEHQG